MSNGVRPGLNVFIPDFVVAETIFDTGGVANVFQCALLDPTRWAIQFGFCSGAGVVSVGTNSQVTATQGVKVSSVLPPLAYNFRDWPGLVGHDWWAVSATAHQFLQVLEVFYRPTGADPLSPDDAYDAIDQHSRLGGNTG